MRKKAAQQPKRAAKVKSTWSFLAPVESIGLTRYKIVAAAVKTADTEGLDQVSMRYLAAQLGASPMALYHYVPSKADLLNLMLDEVYEAFRFEDVASTEWRPILILFASQHRECMERHKWLGLLPVRERQYGPQGIRVIEWYLARLAECGLDVRAAVRVLGVVQNFVIGFVSNELERADTEFASDRFSPQVLASGMFPHVRRMLEIGIEPVSDEAFERSLGWILNGLSSEMPKQRKARSQRPA